MIKRPIGKLERVDVRSVFGNEAADFTPWLNDNLAGLGDLLGLNIVENSTEHNIGKYSCDIVAKDSNTDKKIVIENQYGATNHDHLGKIFTYASGAGASIVIWIAEAFREEHKKALEWINESTDPETGLSFFGVEVRLVKIADSAPAPDFNIIVKPNDWERSIKIASHAGDTRLSKYLNFFTQLSEAWSKARQSGLGEAKPMARYFMTFKIGRLGLRYAWTFSWNKIMVELVVDLEDEKTMKLYSEILANKTAIEKQIADVLKVVKKRRSKKMESVCLASAQRADFCAA